MLMNIQFNCEPKSRMVYSSSSDSVKVRSVVRMFTFFGGQKILSRSLTVAKYEKESEGILKF